MRRTFVEIARDRSVFTELGEVGVSLHSHSMFSKEMLDFLPVYAEKMPIISTLFRREQKKWKRENGMPIDFETAYWSPPLTPQNVYDSERASLAAAGLDPIVSMTDHDDIMGCFEIDDPDRRVPLSLEWTVPFGIGFFHVGVHNLPAPRALAIQKALLCYTFDPAKQNADNLETLFEMLNELPGVLIVLNHPLWDIEIVGTERHKELLAQFLAANGRWIHALEVNGFRAWSENKAVMELADVMSLPVVSGGDRHGCQPNTVVNVTDCRTFTDFASEVRSEGISRIAVLREYSRPLVSRQMTSFAEILGTYPDHFPSHRRWFDRVFFDIHDGRGIVPLSSHGWTRGGPAWLRLAIKGLGALGSPAIEPLVRLFQKGADRVPASIAGRQETMPIAGGHLSSEAA